MAQTFCFERADDLSREIFVPTVVVTAVPVVLVIVAGVVLQS